MNFEKGNEDVEFPIIIETVLFLVNFVDLDDALGAEGS